MNYVNITIGGKERGFKMGLYTLGEVLKQHKVTIYELGTIMVKNPFSLTPSILYHAHAANCLKKGTVIDFTEVDVSDWIEAIDDNPMNNKDVAAVIRAFIDTLTRYLPALRNEPKEGEGPVVDEKKS